MTAFQQQSTAATRSRLAALFGVEPGEGRPLAAMVGLNFTISVAFVLVQTSAFALFIQSFGSHALPYAYFSVAALSSVIAYLFLRLSQRISFSAGLYINLAFLASVSLVFWMGLGSHAARGFVFLLPFWFQTLVNLANLVIWHLAGHMFHVRQAKRLFGLIVAGNWIANIVGGVLIAGFSALVTPATLYLLAAMALVASMLVLRWALAQRPPSSQSPAAAPAPERGTARAGFANALRHPYSRLIFAYTVFWWLGLFVLENVFFHEAEQQITSGAGMATFLGWQLAVMGAIALFTTSILTSRVAHRYGLRIGLLVMPVVVTGAMLLLVIGGSLGWSRLFLFWVATIARTLNIALGFSISQAMGSLLFQPLLGNQRATAQTVAEGIMQPLAIGLAGAILLLFNTLLNFDAVGLSIIFLIIAIPWFWSIFALARQYPLVMSEALRRRSLGEATTLLFDSSAVAQLRASLRHPRPGLALYALNQLEQIAPQAWPQTLIEELPALLAHPAPEVRLEALKRLMLIRAAEAAPILRERLGVEMNSQVCSGLLRALAILQDQESQGFILDALESTDTVVRSGAIVGLLSSGSTAARSRAAAVLGSLAASSNMENRLSACEILGDSGYHEGIPELLKLFGDPSLVVRHAALRAAAAYADPSIVRALAAACDNSATARVAEGVLISEGEQILAPLADLFEPMSIDAVSHGRALSISRVLGRIQHPSSVALLIRMLAVPDLQLRLGVLLSLSKLGYRARPADDMPGRIRLEVEHAAWLHAGLQRLQQSEIADGTAALLNALQTDIRDTRTRILLCLSFLYDPKAVLRARAALEQGSALHSPMALETIDALLPSALKALVLPLLEDAASSDRLERWKSAGVQATVPSVEALLLALLDTEAVFRHSPWTRMCAMYVAALLGLRSCAPGARRAASEPHPGLAQMGHWAVMRLLTTQQKQGDLTVLSIVERVLILKSATLFAETPDNVLAEIAGLVEELAFDSGQTVFKKGDLGDSLYIVYSGSVKVWDGERLLNELGEGEVFGELALLDPEPRLATVKAEEPTNLLRLDAPHFREVLSSQPEVSTAIVRVITKYLRTQLQYAREANARLRALESLTPQAQSVAA